MNHGATETRRGEDRPAGAGRGVLHESAGTRLADPPASGSASQLPADSCNGSLLESPEKRSARTPFPPKWQSLAEFDADLAERTP